MKKQLLLLEDVDGLGRSGDVVKSPRRGFIRNYLLPQKKAVIADGSTLTKQKKLREEREKRAVIDKKASEELKIKLVEETITAYAKVDPEGNMYGSVTQHDIAKMLKEKGFPIERAQVLIPYALKSLGVHPIPLRLKEGVQAEVKLEIVKEVVQEKNA